MNVRRFVGIITTQLYFTTLIQVSYFLKFKDFSRTTFLNFKDLIYYFLRFDINYQNILIIMGLFFLMATIFYENSFVIAYQRITFRNEPDNNSDDASYQMFFD